MNLSVILAIILGTYIAGLHAVALFFELYWRYWWLDCLVHVLGGMFIVSLLGTLVHIFGWPSKYQQRPRITFFVMVIILLWEIFGIIVVGGLKDGFFSDTITDIIFGSIGAYIGYKVISKAERHNS